MRMIVEGGLYLMRLERVKDDSYARLLSHGVSIAAAVELAAPRQWQGDGCSYWALGLNGHGLQRTPWSPAPPAS